MIKTIKKCDISDIKQHNGIIRSRSVLVIFDHDQEDGKSKCTPYFQNVEIEMCDKCWEYMMKNRRYIYAYGAMGHNTYYLKK